MNLEQIQRPFRELFILHLQRSKPHVVRGHLVEYHMTSLDGYWDGIWLRG